MRPLRLRMQAFGPYRQVEAIDFEPLGRHALFLIHGATGAGKTSLLDALCFALYGRSVGGERDDDDLRCDQADADLLTEVRLEFRLDGQIYRLVRTPRQQRPRRRGAGAGDGWVEHAATATLEHFQDPVAGGPAGPSPWIHLASQTSRVTQRVEALLGFDCEQFRQVVVLPQGQFRELLAASSSARERIFEQLFRSGRYRAVEQALREQATRWQRELATLRAEGDGLLQSEELASQDALQDRLAGLANDGLQASAALHAARLSADHAQARWQQAQTLASLQDEQRQASAALVRCQDEATQLVALRQEVRRADCAARLELPLARHAQACAETSAASTALAQMRRALEHAERALELAETAPALEPELAARCEDLRLQLRSLEALAEPLQRWALHRQALDKARLARAEGERDLALQAGALEAARACLAAAQEALDVSRSSAALLPGAEALAEQQHQRLALVRAQAQALDQLAQARREAASCAAQREQAERQLDSARALAQRLQQGWDASQAARLAARLRPDEPCPVCGAHIHPAPATPDAGWVDRADRDAAELAASEANERLQAARVTEMAAHTAIGQLELRCAEFTQQTGQAAWDGTVMDRLKATLAAATRDVAQHRRLAGEVLVRQQQLAQMQARCAALQVEHQLAEERLHRLIPVAESGERQTAVLAALIPAELRAPGKAEARVRLLTEQLEQLESGARKANAALQQARAERHQLLGSCASAIARVEQATLAAQAAEQALHTALQAEGFADQQAVESSIRSQHQMAALADNIQGLERNLAAAEARLHRADGRLAQFFAATAPDLDLDLERSSAWMEQTRVALEAALQTDSRVQAQHQHLQGVARLLARNSEEQQRLEQGYGTLGRIAEVAMGNNPRRISFHRFVLASLLDEVLEAASVRLSRMSRGRFALQRCESSLGGRAPGGLDLEVSDSQSGTLRPVATLSGGEGFLAALSLALGLAEVVQSRAGGARLDTLFIDEGFGTLDAESLDFAVGTLIDLQREGRLVGIISHVTELRERIDARLEVVGGPSGSHVRLHVPGS